MLTTLFCLLSTSYCNPDGVIIMDTASNDSFFICPDQLLHLTCQTNSSFNGWYWSNASSTYILFSLSKGLLHRTRTDFDHYAAYFPSWNQSILVVHNTSKSLYRFTNHSDTSENFYLGCGSSPHNYDRNHFRLLKDDPEVPRVTCMRDANNFYHISLMSPAISLSIDYYNLTLFYEYGENTTSLFKTTNMVIRPNTTGLIGIQILVVDICGRSSSIELNLASTCTGATDPTNTNATTKSSSGTILSSPLLALLLIVVFRNHMLYILITFFKQFCFCCH